jgi:hypothetical protein
MPDPISATIGAVTTIGGGVIQSSAAKRAGNVQAQAADQATAEQRRQFDAMQRLLSPYVQAGGPALQGLMDLAGLSQPTTDWNAFAQSTPELMNAFNAQQMVNPAQFWGFGDIPFTVDGQRLSTPSGMPLEQFAQQWAQQNNADVSQFTTDPQAAAVARIENQPMFQALARQGEEAILQNASATGGLRGGNTQGALARFRPSLLNQFIEQQYGRLAGITSLGQQSAAGVGTAGIQTGANIGNLLMQSGAAQAGAIGAQGQIWGNALGQAGGLIVANAMAKPRPAPSAALLPSVQQTIDSNPRWF